MYIDSLLGWCGLGHGCAARHDLRCVGGCLSRIATHGTCPAGAGDLRNSGAVGWMPCRDSGRNGGGRCFA